MNPARTAFLAIVTLVAPVLLTPVALARGEEDPRDRVRAAEERIGASIEQCRSAEAAGEPAPIDALRNDLESLAGFPEGLKALARYLDHREAFVALLAVRALAGAPEELRLPAGRLLAARAAPKCLTDERRPVYLETVRALGETGYLGGVAPLLETLKRTRDPEVCHAVVEALGRLDDPRAIPVLHDRLSTGTSANLRGPSAGTGRRQRSQNPRQQKGANGAKNNVSVDVTGKLVETLAADSQPVDDKAVVDGIYAALSKLLREDFTSWHAVDEFRREHRKELKTAEALAEQRRREQEREIARVLR